MNVGTVFLVIVILQMYRKVQRDTAVLMDEKETTVTDFSIMVSGFPKIKNIK